MLDVTENVVSRLGFPLFYDGDSVLTASSNLSRDALILVVVEAVLSGESDLVAAANIGAGAVAVLSGESSLDSDAIILVQGSTTLSAEATLTVATNIINLAASLIAGESNLTAVTTRIFFTEIALSGESDLTASGTLINLAVPRLLSGDLNLSAALYEPLNVLVLPTTEYTYTEDVLLRRYTITSGKSLIINGTTGFIQDFLSQDQTLEADYYFAGGHRYVLNPTEVSAVETAGFGDLITIETL
jgi:hypothetical protein